MSNVKKVGSVSWEDGDVGGSDFMRLEEGSNVVRIVSQPYQHYIHWTTDESGQMAKVRCAVEDCILCQRGEQAKPRWLIGVLNRKIGKPAILEIGIQIFKQIKGLRQKKAWGDPRSFDIDLERHPKGSQPLYSITPEAKEPLSKEEVAEVKAFLETTDFEALIKPNTAKEIKEQLGILDSGTDFDNSGTEDTDDSDDDFSFE